MPILVECSFSTGLPVLIGMVSYPFALDRNARPLSDYSGVDVGNFHVGIHTLTVSHFDLYPHHFLFKCSFSVGLTVIIGVLLLSLGLSWSARTLSDFFKGRCWKLSCRNSHALMC